MSNIEDDVKVLEKFMNNEMQRDKLERDDRCGGWKIGDIYKLLELNPAINNLLSEREQDKARIKELEDENRKLKVVRSEYAYGYENTYFITKNDLVQIDKNKYLIEIEEGKFVDLKQVYLDNKNSIPKQNIKDKIEELNRKEQELQNSITEEEREEYLDANISFQLCDIEIRREVLQELLQESEEK